MSLRTLHIRATLPSCMLSSLHLRKYFLTRAWLYVVPVEQPSSIIPGIAHRLCPCGFALSPSLICSVILPMGFCLVPHLQWVILYYPLQDSTLSIMPLRMSPFIDSFARSPWNHKSRRSMPDNRLQVMPIRCITGDSPIHFVIQIYSIIYPTSHRSSFRSGGGSNCGIRPGIKIGNENPVESRVDSPLAAPHFAQSADQVGCWLRYPRGLFYACCHWSSSEGLLPRRQDFLSAQCDSRQGSPPRLYWTSLDSLFRGTNHCLSTPGNYSFYF